MFMFVRKRIPKSPRHHHHHHFLSRFFSASSSQNPDPQTPKFIVADYLISTFGFSPDKAARASIRVARLKSPENPDSVRRFLKDDGFSEADINRLVTWQPDLLCSSPQRTLVPNLNSLRDIGLSTSALNNIILSSPTALVCRPAVSRIRFWMDFLGGDEDALVKAFMQNRGLITHDISQAIAPKISLLQSLGFSNPEIRRMVCMVPQFITSSVSRMEDSLNRVKELGFQPGSGMFLGGLQAMLAVPREALKKRMDLLMSFGWSEDDFFSAVRTAPLMVALKEENMRTKMDFLLGEARCDLSYIASHPLLLNFSLERRLKPRNNILLLLESNGLAVKEQGFYNTIHMSDKKFVDKYILPHKEEIKGLHEAYSAAGAWKGEHRSG